MYDAVILAAGLSSRAEGFKPLFKIGEMTLIERAVSPFLDICENIIVVVGHRFQEIQEVLKDYTGVKVVYNENYLDGMFSSIKCGLKNVESEFFYLTPGDYAFIQENTCMRLQEEDGNIVIPSFNGRKGHPIIMNSILKDEIINCAHVSLRDFIREHEPVIIEVENQEILRDIDTRGDYQRAVKIAEEGYEKNGQRHFKINSKT